MIKISGPRIRFIVIPQVICDHCVARDYTRADGCVFKKYILHKSIWNKVNSTKIEKNTYLKPYPEKALWPEAAINLFISNGLVGLPTKYIYPKMEPTALPLTAAVAHLIGIW